MNLPDRPHEKTSPRNEEESWRDDSSYARFRESRKSRGRLRRRKKGLPQRELLPRGSLYCKQTACIAFEKLGGEEEKGQQRCTCSPLTRRGIQQPSREGRRAKLLTRVNVFFVNPSPESRNDAHLPRDFEEIFLSYDSPRIYPSIRIYFYCDWMRKR